MSRHPFIRESVVGGQRRGSREIGQPSGRAGVFRPARRRLVGAGETRFARRAAISACSATQSVGQASAGCLNVNAGPGASGMNSVRARRCRAASAHLSESCGGSDYQEPPTRRADPAVMPLTRRYRAPPQRLGPESRSGPRGLGLSTIRLVISTCSLALRRRCRSSRSSPSPARSAARLCCCKASTCCRKASIRPDCRHRSQSVTHLPHHSFDSFGQARRTACPAGNLGSAESPYRTRRSPISTASTARIEMVSQGFRLRPGVGSAAASGTSINLARRKAEK